MIVINKNKIVDLQEYKNTKETRIRSYTIIDMVLDPKKKKEADDFYDSIYEDIEEDNCTQEFLKKIQNEPDNNKNDI